MRRLLLIIAASLVFVCPLLAQDSPPIPVSLLGNDGNYYGASGNEFYSYTPATQTTKILNAATNSLELCLERSDGYFLGINNPTNGSWQLVKVSFSGVITPIATFPTTLTLAPSCPAMANDGNYYGASHSGGGYSYGFLYELTAAGALNMYYNFAQQLSSLGAYMTGVQASDGNFYYYAGDELVKYSTSAGLTITSLPDYVGVLPGQYPLEGPDGNFYAMGSVDGGFDHIFQVSPTGQIKTLYVLSVPTDDEEGGQLDSLWVLKDGLAFSQYFGYLNSDENDDCYGEGNYEQMFALGTDGTLGANLVNIGVDEGNDTTDTADSDLYGYSFILGGNDTFYGVYRDAQTVDYGQPGLCYSSTNSIGPINIQTASPSPAIELSLNKTHVLPGGSATLTWNVQNAFSDTMQQCYGYGGLSGKLPLSGSLTGNAPAASGAYTSAIICGGTETATATLNVGNATLSLASGATVVAVGQSVTLSATVTNAATPAPTGTVQFFYGSQVIGSAALSSGVAKFTASTTGVPAGTYSITAHYLGDANYGPANSSAVSIQLVARYPSTTSVSPTSQTVLAGAHVTLTGIVTGTDNAEPPTGTVTFMTGSSVLATRTLSVQSGTTAQASFTASTAGIATGTYPVTARYNGDAYNLASTSANASATIAATVAQVSASPNPVPSGSSFTLTATVQGKVTPTGTVIFYDGSSQLASTSLNSSGIGTVTLPSGTLPSGSYSITVYYAGDPNNGAVTSPAISLTVD